MGLPSESSPTSATGNSPTLGSPGPISGMWLGSTYGTDQGRISVIKAPVSVRALCFYGLASELLTIKGALQLAFAEAPDPPTLRHE